MPIFTACLICVTDFGAVGDDVTDDTAAIQAAMDHAASLPTGGSVLFPAGYYRISAPLIQDSRVFLTSGGGLWDVVIRPTTGFTGSALIKTRGFDTYNAGDYSIVRDTGIPYGYGVWGLALDGMQAVSRCYEGYGKFRYMKITCTDAVDDCFFHACGKSTGIETTPVDGVMRDLWEGVLDIDTARSGRYGVHFMGPHDAHIIRSVNVLHGDWHFFIDYDDNRDGGCRIGRVHTYGGSGGGVRFRSSVQGDHVIAENGVLIEGYTETLLNIIQTRNSSSPACVQIAGPCDIGMIRANCNMGDVYPAANGVEVSASRVKIGQMRVLGASGGGAGTGLVIASTASDFWVGKADIRAFGAVGGKGLSIDGADNVRINGRISSCETNASFAPAGDDCHVELDSYVVTGQQHYSGSLGARSKLLINGFGASFLAKEAVASGTISTAATGPVVGYVTFPRPLSYTPGPSQVNVMLTTRSDNAVTARVERIAAISATSVQVVFTVTNAVAGSTYDYELRVAP
ncbi:MAG: hypothetical protein CMO30_05425 [Tistrella sp.]|uniref:Rhamnogalacturonase A/B/Epimerase-like pectate lyase domain-containing protein n=1 Tax=Tistrella mobilis TaxID=171437 RepID=A0A3B9ISB2_9PROT|nr:glycoside hydrolase family 55 protein [Tistrella sp.]MAD39061.1 hypothetical protein [Tistrella sp.]MBA74708.1 hypothetical protein [Tistrella sp.]HAE50640.1 hypothetical protein [Tistrella mobilis]